MRQFVQTWRDLLLLLSLLLLILLYPVLDRGDVQRMLLGGVMFAPLILATIKVAQLKSWRGPQSCYWLVRCLALCSVFSSPMRSSLD